jgi:hypothetical protein
MYSVQRNNSKILHLIKGSVTVKCMTNISNGSLLNIFTDALSIELDSADEGE